MSKKSAAWMQLALGASLAVLVGSCSSGSSSSASTQSPTLPALSFYKSTATVIEGGEEFQLAVILSTSGAPLDSPVSVEVVDPESGTASEGIDYRVTGLGTITFPEGSEDGDLQWISVTAFDDLHMEGADETASLQLVNPVNGLVEEAGNFDFDILEANGARVQFVDNQSGPFGEFPAEHKVSVRFELDPGVTMDVDASVTVADLGIGSAESGDDYRPFVPQVLTFPAGSPSGVTQSVAVFMLGDDQPEIDETIVLGLESASPGTQASSLIYHVLSILDDDGSGAPELSVTEGALGTENPLANNDLIQLGSKVVGSEEDVSTRFRVTNSGDAAMSLEAPRFNGTNSNDFQIQVDSISLGASDSGEALLATHDMYTPLHARPDATGPGLSLELDTLALEEMHAASKVRLLGFELPEFGQVTLELERQRLPLTPDAMLFVDGKPVEGGLRAALGKLSVWSGKVLEIPGSRVFFTFAESGPRGFLELPLEGRHHLLHLITESRATSTTPALCRIVSEEEYLLTGGERLPFECGALHAQVEGADSQASTSPTLISAAGDMALTVSDCRLAIETDFQLFEKFDSTEELANYVVGLIAAVSDQYYIDLQTTISIAYLGVYSNPSDPWVTQDIGDGSYALLYEFQDAWAFGNWPVEADLAHFLSGANLGGGVAWISTLCSKSLGFGVSTTIQGNLDWGTWGGEPVAFVGDFYTVAHELGHNFGAEHTHDYCPPLDHCANNCDDSTFCSQGTFMSYCNHCGSYDYIDLNFHPKVANTLRWQIASSCLQPAAFAPGDFIEYVVRFNPLTETGLRKTTLELHHDAPNEPQPFKVNLEGTAE